MDKNSYILKRMYKIKKNNSTSLSSLNSYFNRNNKYTYELDRKEEIPNSNKTNTTFFGNKFNKNISNDKNGSYISININKNISENNINKSNNSKGIGSVNENVFRKIMINKAPSFYMNKMVINKIIKKKKLQKLMDYENFYNNMRTHHTLYNISKIKLKNIDDIYNENNNLFHIPKIRCFKSKSTSNIFPDFSHSRKRYRSKTDGYNNELEKKEMKTNYIRNINKNQTSHRIINKESTLADNSEKSGENNTYKGEAGSIPNSSVLMTLLPFIPKSKRMKNKYNNSNRNNNSRSKSNSNSPQNILKDQKNEDVKLYNFSTQKLGNYILDTLEMKKRTVRQFTILEKKIVKLKYFQNIHKQRLNIVLLNDKFNLDNKIDYLLKLNRIYNNIWTNYRLQINLYLHFLFDKKVDMETDLGIILHKKKLNEKKIEKLMIQTVKKQIDLEELVQIRNFLFQVKLRLKKQPEYFQALLHRDSRKIELGNIIITSTVGTKNSSVIKFLDSFSVLNLVQLYEIHPMNSLLKLFQKKMNNKKGKIPKEFKEKYIYQEDLLKNEKNIPKKGEIIFDSPDQFLEIFHNLESKNLYLLHRNNAIKKESSTLRDYENYYLLEENLDDDSKIEEEIIYREKYLKRIKEKNKYLIEKLKSVSSKEFIDNNLYTKKLIQQQANSSFVELNFFKMINYIKLLEGYKYHYVLLLEKMNNIIKTFIDLKYGEYTLNRCYIFIEKTQFDHILKLNKKNINESNKFKVYDYVLELLKLYYDICNYVKKIQRQYEADENNKIFMKKRTEEVQTQRKISNAREIRELLEDKRERVIDKILEKWNRPVNKALRKVDDKSNTTLSTKFRSKSIEEINKIKKEKKQNEINGLIFFD